MQIRKSQLKGDRPVCPAGKDHRVHGHGSYTRFRYLDGDATISVQRWICTLCFLTFSVIPDEVLPYRSIGTEKLEKGFDHAFSGKDPPTLSEKETGALNRALQSFIINIPFLTNQLGQIVNTIRPSAKQLWQELRVLRDLKSILFYLAECFKTSLLKDYRCLKPFVRGNMPPKIALPDKKAVPQTC